MIKVKKNKRKKRRVVEIGITGYCMHFLAKKIDSRLMKQKGNELNYLLNSREIRRK